ncbi:lymphocyte antigen 6G6e-like isoform X2 [Acinonyx jubatus]|uniref:Lymphocyte antigen 6G6e-like isoform X2 n=1 Tax=Acinonyx jubatus TaxID=32536 RepID=A0ABM3Q511_ACIJB|nr:lymphocyte antigen 6G6e-like isoform X2 [Acinonyx jubatus]
MRSSSICLCLLFLCGALGLTTSPTRGRLRCYTCSFSKPCYPVLTECQDDEVCGISIGTSGRTLVPWLYSRPISIHPSCFSCCPTHSLCLLPARASAFPLCPTEQSEIIERKGCLPRAQCPLQGHATYWSRSYALRHHCCEQNLCNTATMLQRLPSPLLITLLLLVASFMWGAHLLH